MDYFSDFLFNDRRALSYVIDKDRSCKSIMKYMLQRLMKMFRYKNLPDTIPREYLEMYLLVNGQCIIAKGPNQLELYAFTGSAGGEPDPYYRPTKYMVANPGLKFSKEFSIGEDCILVRNDSMWQGLYPMMGRYASLIAENFVTMRISDIMLRSLALITAPDDNTKAAADIYLKKLVNGELAAVAENRFLDGIKMQSPPSNNGSYLTQFIELHQYYIGQFFNEIGLNANYNMKREALSESETGLNEDSLLPLCEDMLRCRKEDIEKVNSMFGTEISVDFDSEWKENVLQEEIEIIGLAQEKQVEELEDNNNDNSTEIPGAIDYDELVSIVNNGQSEEQPSEEQPGEGSNQLDPEEPSNQLEPEELSNQLEQETVNPSNQLEQSATSTKPSLSLDDTTVKISLQVDVDA